MIAEIIKRLPEEVKRNYPSHIFEPIRSEIACSLVLKECYKPPAVSCGQTICPTAAGWLAGEGQNLTPVDDFWNLMEGIVVSLKGKDIVPQLTSAHITWQQEELDPRHLTLYWPVGTLDQFGLPPYTYDVIKRHILDSPIELALNRHTSDYHAATTELSRDVFPIIVRRNLDDTFQLLDGNRRTLRSLLYNRPTISAWVGTVTKAPPLRNHWVNKGFLRRLVSEYANDQRPETKRLVRAQLKYIFDSTEIARYQYQKYCMAHNPLAVALANGLL